MAPTFPGYGDDADGTEDVGYGDAADGTEDVGYGDTPDDPDAVTLIPLKGSNGEEPPEWAIPDTLDGVPLFSDEGGHVLTLRRLYGVWTSRGPYRVQLISASGKVYPLGAEGCFSGEPGFGVDCYADASRRKIRFVLPSLPSGVYKARVFYGPVQMIEVANVARVVPRPRAWPEAYSIARNLGGYAKVAGSLDVRAELEASDSNRPPYGPWEALSRAFGRGVREIGGTPTSRLRGDHETGDTVLSLESVLAFTSRGWLWVDGRHLEYTSRDVAARELSLRLPLPEGLPGNTPVVLDVKALAHPGLYAEPDPVPALIV